MKLGIIRDWDEEGFAFAKKKRLSFIEYTVDIGSDVAAFCAMSDDFKKWEEQYGVAIGSIGRWGVSRIDAKGDIIEEELNNSYRLIDTCEKLNCPVFVCGCNYIAERTYLQNCNSAIEYFSKLIEYARPKGVKIAVYNCDWNNFVYDARAWDIILPTLPELGLKYDTSHCINRHGDFIKEMSIYGDRIYHTHIKGCIYIDGKYYDNPPAGLDETNWGAFFNMLYVKNYNGGLSIEPHSRFWKGDLGEWGIDFTIRYIRPYIMPEDYTPDK